MLKNTRFKGSSAVRALAVTGALMMPGASSADEVTLKSVDGSVDLVGELLRFENNVYTVRTIIGELNVSAEQVRCSGADCPVFDEVETDLVLAGSDTVGLGLMPLLLEGWAASQDAEASMINTPGSADVIAQIVGDQGFGEPINAVKVSSTTSGDAFRYLLSGEADIGMASRPINPQEANILRAAGKGNLRDSSQEHIIAVDSLVVIVHPDNPVGELTIDQMAGIYSGQIRNWAEVGGKNAPINIHDFRDGSGTRSSFLNAVFGANTAEIADAQVQPNNAEMSDTINKDPNAIGYVGYAFKRGAKTLSLVNECGITMTPDAFSVRTEEYSLQRRLYLYNAANGLSEDADAFVDYVQSSEADEMIEKSGFISLGVDARTQSNDSQRALALLQPSLDPTERTAKRQMLRTMTGYDRLSSTFRFRTGSSQLDERAPIDMERLTEHLKDAPEGTRVLFVGFTDSVGTYRNNQNLSERRAAAVMNTMANSSAGVLANIQMSSTGFGEIVPSACNVNAQGREINRRVEVWVSTPGQS